MEEERRLCYVGITRAKEELFLTYANRRTTFGSIAYNAPSRFLKEIPSDLFHTEKKKGGRGPVVSSFDPDEDENAEYRRPKPKLWTEGPKSPTQIKSEAEAATFKVGQKVRHAVFGVGVVLNVKTTSDDTQVEAAFANVGVKKLLLSLARLEKVN